MFNHRFNVSFFLIYKRYLYVFFIDFIKIIEKWWNVFCEREKNMISHPIELSSIGEQVFLQEIQSNAS